MQIKAKKVRWNIHVSDGPSARVRKFRGKTACILCASGRWDASAYNYDTLSVFKHSKNYLYFLESIADEEG